METQNDKIQEHVLEKIRSSEVRMRPKFYFSFKIVLLCIVLLGILVISSFLFSFIIFTIRISGHLFLLGFGEKGFQAFFLLFPWKFLFLDLILILVLEWIVKQFRLGYRSPLAYLLCGIFFLTVIFGTLIDLAHVHEALLHKADQRGLPVMGDYYEHLRRPPPDQGVVSGFVEEASGTSFSIESAGMYGTSTMIWKVILPPGVTILGLTKGDEVLVAGDLDGNMIRAYGIKKIEKIPSEATSSMK